MGGVRALLSSVGLAVGSWDSVLFGPAVGPSVGVGSGVGTGVDLASSIGVFAGSGVAAAMLVGDVVPVGSGVDVAPVQAIMAASVNRSRAVVGSRGCGIDRGPSFDEVRLPFYWVLDLYLSLRLSAISAAHTPR